MSVCDSFVSGQKSDVTQLAAGISKHQKQYTVNMKHDGNNEKRSKVPRRPLKSRPRHELLRGLYCILASCIIFVISVTVVDLEFCSLISRLLPPISFLPFLTLQLFPIHSLPFLPLPHSLSFRCPPHTRSPNPARESGECCKLEGA